MRDDGRWIDRRSSGEIKLACCKRKQSTQRCLAARQPSFESQNPQFDDDWKQHVESSVASYRLSIAAAIYPMHEMDAPITTGDIISEMQRLGNGKAASPVSGIYGMVPNELIKYGGQPMAAMLSPVFNTVWCDGRPPAMATRRRSIFP